MSSLLNKKSIIGTIIALFLILMIGCSSTKNTSSDSTSSNKGKNEVSNNSNTDIDSTKTNSASTGTGTINPGNSTSKDTKRDTSQNALLESIKKLALQGRIINCDFQAKYMCIEAVEEKWGKADKSEWVTKAQGQYWTYSKYNVAFGYGKGDLIFEVRSYDKRLGQISISMVKNIYGTPAYDVKASGEEIIGYKAGEDFKILLVFPQPTESNKDPLMHHYSVLYPGGTGNSMAQDEPPREW